uniref:Down syndrome cell adhesion molecule-like protein Dscam2 n=1 Tax=Strigamia maritima TaxID=126957 RepID=T1IT66_STRMM
MAWSAHCTRCTLISIQIGILIFNTVIQVQAIGDQSETPQFVYEPPDLVQFSNINGSTVKCQGRGKPQPTVAWLLSDGTPVSSVPGLRQLMYNGQLRFPPFKPEDYRQDIHAIIYRCSISNTHGVIISRDVQIQAVVNQPYQIFVTKSYTMKGNTGVIRCHVPQFLQEFVEVTAWIIDDKLIISKTNLSSDETSQKSKYIVSPSGDLFLTNVEMQDSNSTFQCKMRHKLSKETKVSSVGRLQVTNPVGNVPPRIVDKDLQVTANAGDTTFIPCIAEGHPVPNVQWFVKDKSGVQSVVLKSDRILLTLEGMLIKNVNSNDRKIFVCVASNSIGSDNKEVALTITEPLKVSMIPDYLISDKGQTLSFACNVTGFPMPTHITWFKDGRILTENDDVILNGFNLIIKVVKSSHKGIYQCIVNNGKHSAQAKAELVLGDSPPEFIDTFMEQTLKPNQFLSLQCSASGTPMPEISWSLDETPLSKNIQTSILDGCVTSFLNISSIKTDQGGVYKCTAKNKAGQLEHMSRINVYGPLSAKPTLQMFAVAGENVYLNCPVVGYPINSLIWKKDDIILPFDLQQEVLKNKTLVISKAVKSGDAGRYVCIVSNKQGQLAESSVLLSILVPPKILPFQFQDNLSEGVRAQLHCVVSEGDLPLTIIWTKDEKPIAKELLINIRNIDDYSSILSISNVTAFHNGNYTCIAANNAAKAHHTAALLVKVPPRWQIMPHNSTVKKHDSISVPCRANGFPPPEIKWTKILGDVATGQRIELNNSKAFNVLPDGTLQINEAKLEDQGFYFCSANNQIGKGLSRVIYIKVQAPVYFENEIVELKVKINSTAELFCEVFGDLPIRVVWQTGNTTLQNSKKYWNTIMNSNSTFKTSSSGMSSITSKLSILEVSKSDSGEYYCEGRNSYGSAKTIIKLIVQEKPLKPEIVNVKNLDNRSVEVFWKPGNPNDLIYKYILQYKKKYDSWVYKRVVTEYVDAQFNSKVINQLQPATAYEFRIAAENEVGSSNYSDTITIVLNEEAPEGPPQQVEVEATDRDSLRISWKTPLKSLWNGPIRGYYIGYKVADSSQQHTFKIFEVPEDYTNTLVYQLTNLKIYTKYSIVVMAYNNGGSGPTTKEITIMTSEDVPRSPPQEIRCSTLSSHSVYVVWDNLPPEDVNGLLLGYKVFYKALQKWNIGVEQWNTTSVSRLALQQLQANTNYSFEVLAYTKIGDGVRSEPVYCMTYQEAPEAPKHIKALPSSANSILLSWQYPFSRNSEITMYNIYHKQIRDNEEVPVEYSFKDDAKPPQDKTITVHTLGPETNFFEFKNLNRNQRYAFWVAATSAVGKGPNSKIVLASPKSTPIAAKSASFSDSLSIPWKTDITLPCIAVGIPLPRRRWLNGTKEMNTDEHRIMIRFDGALIIKKSEETDSNTYTCVVENIYGRDQVQYTIIVQFPPQAPNLYVMSKSLYSINLKWEMFYEGRNNLRGFLLHYKRDKGEWVKRDFGPDHNSFRLQNLTCGATYFIYVEAYNDVGVGKPCETISVTTQENHFVIPSKESIIDEGDTYIILNLDAWPKEGCLLQYFTVKYKQQSASGFKEIPIQYQPFDKQVKIAGLESGNVYNLRLTAHTKGESKVADYQVVTTSLESLGPPNVIQKEEKIVISMDICTDSSFNHNHHSSIFKEKKGEDVQVVSNQPPHWSEFGTLERTHPDLGVSVDSFIHMQRAANNTLGRHTYGTLQRVREGIKTSPCVTDPNPYATVHIPIFSPSHEMNFLSPDVPPPIPPGPEISTLDRAQDWRYFENQHMPKNPHSWDQGYASAAFADGENIYATTRKPFKNVHMQNTLPISQVNDPSSETTFVFPNISESHEQSPVRGLIAGNVNTTSTGTQHNTDLLN